MNEIQLQYKRETGNNPLETAVEAERNLIEVDFQFENYTKREILNILSRDFHPGFFLTDIDAYKIEDNCIIIPDSGYVKWLEEKVEELRKEKK
jgi:hypothetical protein